MSRFARRTAAWIATFAILIGALAPGITNLLASRSADGVLRIALCTISGVRLVAVAQAAAAGGDHRGHADHGEHAPGGVHAEHCPYCKLHAGSFGLPPPEFLHHIAAADGHDFLPELFYRSPSARFPWAAARPRAPPVLA